METMTKQFWRLIGINLVGTSVTLAPAGGERIRQIGRFQREIEKFINTLPKGLLLFLKLTQDFLYKLEVKWFRQNSTDKFHFQIQ